MVFKETKSNKQKVYTVHTTYKLHIKILQLLLFGFTHDHYIKY